MAERALAFDMRVVAWSRSLTPERAEELGVEFAETPEDVARRLDKCLEYAPMERLGATCDCGFSALPRYLARQKMQALVAGAKLVRGRA